MARAHYIHYAEVLCQAQLAEDPTAIVEAMVPFINELSKDLYRRHKSVIIQGTGGYSITPEDIAQEFWLRFLRKWTKILPYHGSVYQAIRWIFGRLGDGWYKNAAHSVAISTNFHDKRKAVID
jgi:DNA-directed RNA polymerase specialized sigma24 family protein